MQTLHCRKCSIYICHIGAPHLHTYLSFIGQNLLLSHLNSNFCKGPLLVLFHTSQKTTMAHVHVQTRYDAMINSTGTGKEILNPVDENYHFWSCLPYLNQVTTLAYSF